jgi:hypothetical protein
MAVELVRRARGTCGRVESYVMGAATPTLSSRQMDFIRSQDLFFVATAPLAASERVNVSPKGYGSATVIDSQTVGYLDLTGSGAETAAHIRQNGRITLLFFAFVGDPLILRVYGRGQLVRPEDGGWQKHIGHFAQQPGQRQIILVHIEEVREACGYMGNGRKQLTEWSEELGADGLARFRERNNAASIDGLPTGLVAPEKELFR